MDYAQELKDLLRPLGVYTVDQGLNGAELDSIGAALDVVDAGLETAEREANPVTAEGAGLDTWERLLPFAPASATLADRRRALTALLRIRSGSFTPAAINDTVAGCGIRAVVAETDTAQTVQVSFPYDRGIPDRFDEIRARIEQILPCHLDVVYSFLYLTWQEAQAMFASWAALQAGAANWDTLERLGGEAA